MNYWYLHYFGMTEEEYNDINKRWLHFRMFGD